jgi:3',5'-cyclic AMP phosphodiesterase CpdA
MYKILHLSDPHIGYRKCGERFRKIVNNIIHRENPEETIIVITGDLVEDAFREKNISEAEEVVDLLKKNGFRVLITPGNHDYGNGWVNKVSIADKFMDRFKIEFPKVDLIGDNLFIGLDSNVEELHWYDRFFADGEIGKEQFDFLEEIINRKEYADKKKIVYLHHHPIDLIIFHRLKDYKKLKEVLQGKVDVVLYGHNHTGKNHSGEWGIKVMLDGGSSTGKRMLGRRVKHRIVDLADFSIQENNYL